MKRLDTELLCSASHKDYFGGVHTHTNAINDAEGGEGKKSALGTQHPSMESILSKGSPSEIDILDISGSRKHKLSDINTVAAAAVWFNEARSVIKRLLPLVLQHCQKIFSTIISRNNS